MRSRETERMWKLAGRYSSIGIEMATAVTIGVLLGIWLDGLFDSEPWLFLAGLVVGLGAAVLAVVRVVRQTKRGRIF